MIEEIIQFYKSELSSWALIYRHNKTYLVILALFIFLVIWMFFSFITRNWLYTGLGYLLLITCVGVTNQLNKSFIKKKYKVQQKKLLFGGLEFYKIKLKLLKDYLLNEHNIDEVKKFDVVIDRLYKEADNRKFSGYFISGLGVAMFISSWNQFQSRLFAIAGEMEEIATLFSYFLFMGMAIVFLTGVVKVTLNDILERDARKIKDLATMAEDVRLDFVANHPGNEHNVLASDNTFSNDLIKMGENAPTAIRQQGTAPGGPDNQQT